MAESTEINHIKYRHETSLDLVQFLEMITNKVNIVNIDEESGEAEAIYKVVEIVVGI